MQARRIQLLKDSVEKDPADPFNYYALAMEYLNINPDKALNILVRLQGSHEDYLPTYYQLASLLYESDQTGEAKTILEKGIELAIDQQDLKTKGELQAVLQNILFEE